MSTSSRHSSPHPWWPVIRKVLTWIFFILVAVLLVYNGSKIEWGQVAGSIQRYELSTLGLAWLFAVASIATLTSYDLLGRVYTGHSLGIRQVMSVSFVAYVLSLNLGAFIGGIGFRYRLYSRLGLENGVIARIYTLSLLTNWIPYLVLAGIVFALRLAKIPQAWKLGTDGLQVLGFIFLAVAALYLWLCTFSKRRSWTFRDHEITLPSLRFALAQLAMGALNWLAIAATLFVLFRQDIPYPTILGIYLISSVAVLIIHVPAGLGVLETVFIVLLREQASRYEVIAALLAFRAVYYLFPLLLAVPVYFGLETRGKKQA